MTTLYLVGGGVLIVGLLVFLYGRAQRNQGFLQLHKELSEKNAEVLAEMNKEILANDKETHDKIKDLRNGGADFNGDVLRDYWNPKK